MQDFYDDEIDDIEWDDAPTPGGRPRVVGVVPDTFATIEIYGDKDAVDEIAYQVVFDGTNMDINFDRALPMIRMAQEYVSEKAAMFIGSKLDEFAFYDAVPAGSQTRRFEDSFVRFLSIDVVNAVNVTISVGRRPTKP